MNLFLVAAAISTALAALLHLVCIALGPKGYRFFGAGDRMIAMAEAGHPRPAAVTFLIACMLLLWALYALSGAGLFSPLPLTEPALWVIACVFLVRGVLGPFAIGRDTQRSPRFWIVSSLICTAIGLCYLIGSLQMPASAA